MQHPIQAWYATGIEDRNGTLILNDEETTGFTSSANGMNGGMGPLATVPSLNVEGSLLRTGLQSEMAHVYVLADTNKTGDFKLGPIADYIAMLALSQTQALTNAARCPASPTCLWKIAAPPSSPPRSPTPTSPISGASTTWIPAPISRSSNPPLPAKSKRRCRVTAF